MDGADGAMTSERERARHAAKRRRRYWRRKHARQCVKCGEQDVRTHVDGLVLCGECAAQHDGYLMAMRLRR